MNDLTPLPAAPDLALPPGLPDGGAPVPRALSRKEKAAVIVRLLLSEGADLSLAKLPDDMQSALTEQLGQMKPVDRATLTHVAEEFAREIDAIALSFPGGIGGALSMLDGRISPAIAAKLRRESGLHLQADPWERITGLEAATLLPVVEAESIELGAVVLSKLTVAKAAELLGMLPGEKARRVAYAMSLTGAVTPGAVQKIGLSIADQLDTQPEMAFDTGPVERVGAILNFSPSATRDEVLAGLDQDDAGFAAEVRKAIFTFANIPARIDARDVPKIMRGLDQAVLVTALAAASATGLEASAEFLLDNMSKRMAEGLREEMGEAGTIKPADGEAAMSAVIAEIRELETAGEIYFVAEDD